MATGKRIILEDNSTLHSLAELLLHIEGRGQFVIKKDRDGEATLRQVRQ